MRRATAFGIAMLVLVCLASTALAFNPQPEPPAAPNELNAVARDLVQIRIRLNVAFAHPPEPGMVGEENQFDAMAIKLGVLYDRVDSVLYPPDLGSPPPDDERLLDALRNARGQAEGIVSDIRNSPPPDDDFDSLNAVRDGAQAIIDLATEFIGDGTAIIGGE